MVGGGEDFEVVEAAAGAAEEGALAVAEFFFGGFGAVLVDGVGPAVGDAGEEVVVVLDRGAGSRLCSISAKVTAGVGDVADVVQGGGDDGSGAGGDGPVGQGGGGFFAGRGHGLAGDAGAGEGGGGEGEAAAGFARC